MAKTNEPKLGRPPKDLAGKVRERILDAAEQLFLERGFRSTSIDEIAERAPASKPTIYAHFPGKEALFTAVIGRAIAKLTDFDGFVPQGQSTEDKLVALGTEIVERFFADTVDLIRAMIAEAQRFPGLSRDLHDAAQRRVAGVVSEFLGDATQATACAAKVRLDGSHKLAIAQLFVDIIVLPMLMRSLLGAEPKDLNRELPPFLHERVRFFLAACESLGAQDGPERLALP
ncbi:Transcriptional regulatory protein [Bradyrhizobium sp. STM 3843]|uniref:TetR/AcrR family transcriptional regulator n=1 Tax=Bradyrhizobium sp. STM 3843 TaxID=551947 RepID=UPI0002403692|nr:TetR/AcrR family transcriptional regulator [Bradyrhizobium sp. STM 3843]CCE08407.1 Transcriptional regulatory protein [Bradyrhizobium sp. STM 3843]